jgi:hypothetical protein
MHGFTLAKMKSDFYLHSRQLSSKKFATARTAMLNWIDLMSSSVSRSRICAISSIGNPVSACRNQLCRAKYCVRNSYSIRWNVFGLLRTALCAHAQCALASKFILPLILITCTHVQKRAHSIAMQQVNSARAQVLAPMR